LNEKKHNELKKIDNFKLEYDDNIRERNEQMDLIKNNIEKKLEYFSNREFTLQQIQDECDYSKTFDKYKKYFIINILVHLK